ncbi:molybdopterin molybdotransferase [Methylomarinovum caldicuralii]|uniref:Molybdopterin molybdenumtransferase n=1 Tax=Methylomarinovum caldicuralii TaxID=438856 RepID=A0AAU9C3P4_9GAMM|nr:gephyrin-like molybdotransferase Glp [Methylomarinovum caldicuralii]BCX81840.1 molybdopterin molybdotransferase [Methylomarinovum caldicuralii]
MTYSIPQPNCIDSPAAGTLTVAAAGRRILEATTAISGEERIPLHHGLHRILATAVTAPLDVPAHTNAAVDGFALRGADLPDKENSRLRIVGTALAGHPWPHPLAPGQAVRIMTGAPLPAGADTVLMQEQVTEAAGYLLVPPGHKPGENVRLAGEDLCRGETVLEAGHYLLPPDLGLIASLGLLEVTVKRRLRVALVSTGDEILPQGAPHAPGKLYDSNRFSLRGALQARLGVELLDGGIVPDDEARLEHRFRTLADKCDVIIASGGVSVGSADYTKKVLARLGGIEFWKVAIKPGRPLAFGHIGDCLFFGLPGNPVAVLVTFYRFVLPALFKRAGARETPMPPTFPARAAERLRKKPGRTEFQRGILERDRQGRWQVRTTGKQGSGILSSMSRADCFIVLEHDRGPVQPGEWVEVLPFSALM